MSTQKSSLPTTPPRHFENQELSSDGIPATGSTLCFGQESFTSPMATRYGPPSSPPKLCKERKRARTNTFQSMDGSIMLQFLLPKLDFELGFGLDLDSDSDHDVDSDMSINEDRLRVRLTPRFHIRQRLTHPSTPTIREEEKETVLSRVDVLNTVAAAVSGPASSVHRSSLSRRPSFILHQAQNQDKSNESILIGVGLDSTSRSGMKRRNSSSALSA